MHSEARVDLESSPQATLNKRMKEGMQKTVPKRIRESREVNRRVVARRAEFRRVRPALRLGLGKPRAGAVVLCDGLRCPGPPPRLTRGPAQIRKRENSTRADPACASTYAGRMAIDIAS